MDFVAFLTGVGIGMVAGALLHDASRRSRRRIKTIRTIWGEF
jgi:hypothetical protein